VREFQPKFQELDLLQLPNHRIYLKLGTPSAPFSASTLPPLPAVRERLTAAVYLLPDIDAGSKAELREFLLHRNVGFTTSNISPNPAELYGPLRRLSAMAENTARNFAQRATAYTEDTFEKSKTTAQEATKVMEHSYVTASKSAVDFNLKLIDMAQESINKQLENLTRQTQHLTGLAQQAVTETAQSWQSATKTFNQPSR
jgi:hypothetical protein